VLHVSVRLTVSAHDSWQATGRGMWGRSIGYGRGSGARWWDG